MITHVEMKKSAQKEIEKAPVQVRRKFALWISSVRMICLEKTRKFPSYHDEPLHGQRKGQRSIRLNDQWRAFYIIKNDETVEFVEIQEITAHEYKP